VVAEVVVVAFAVVVTAFAVEVNNKLDTVVSTAGRDAVVLQTHPR